MQLRNLRRQKFLQAYNFMKMVTRIDAERAGEGMGSACEAYELQTLIKMDRA